ncbi:hypothetical protein G7Y89_g1476 [Cudoniella acicularis]|uniref:Uncharacterized protein n=1 Tax=Cudoniella acicularis TaxID=354080 RepID=A0A8H4W6Z4_9HELO|nr:hypothetical protein G7Y89_g1476 [Cudoniella acicularis]
MLSNTVFLVTGANRGKFSNTLSPFSHHVNYPFIKREIGIGFGIVALLLLRPDTMVIVTVRSATTSTSELTSLPLGKGSNLIIAHLDISSSPSAIEASAKELHDTLTTQFKITHINTIIANAGMSSFQPTILTPLSSLTDNFNTNTLGPIALFQALYPLLSAPGNENPKFVVVSSALGSISDMEGAVPTLAYGVSKAGVNYFVRKAHFECPEITVLAVHPGWVKTENGQNFADCVGVKEPPMTLEDSVKSVLEQVDGATKSDTSGTFVSYDGTPIGW